MNKILVNSKLIISILFAQTTLSGGMQYKSKSANPMALLERLLLDLDTMLLEVHKEIYYLDEKNLNMFLRLKQGLCGDDETITPIISKQFELLQLLKDAGFENPNPIALSHSEEYETLEKYLTCLETLAQTWGKLPAQVLLKEITDVRWRIGALPQRHTWPALELWKDGDTNP